MMSSNRFKAEGLEGGIPSALFVERGDESPASDALVDLVGLVAEARAIRVYGDVSFGGDLVKGDSLVEVHRGVRVIGSSEWVW